MRIQHNIMAMNSYRNFNNNTSALSSNLEKLSSGYRINRAGDDAAGLAISEKMRAQITGLDAAQKNVNDGISLVKTAEGALQEVQDMLNRMVYLAEQSANGTYDSTVDRAALQEEVNALKTEIDRIADSSNFNGTKLLDGSLGGAAKVSTVAGADAVGGAKAKYTIDFAGLSFTSGQTVIHNGVTVTEGTTTGVAATNTVEQNIAAIVDAWKADTAKFGNYDISVTGTVVTIEAKNIGVDANAATMKTTMTGTATITSKAVTEAVTGAAPTTAAKGATTKLDLTGRTGEDVIGSTITIDGATYEFVEAAGDVTGTNKAVVVAKTDNATTMAGTLATAIKNAATTNVDTTNTQSNGAVVEVVTADTGADAEALAVTQVGKGLILQIGDTSDSYNQLALSIDSMKCADILTNGTVDISTQSAAKAEIDQIKASINTVSAQRGRLGAIQNRLEHTAKNLSVMEENIQNAESTIRDTDIADEMTAYTKNNILLQSAQAMLAQANQVPQGVLQLLQ